MNNIKAISQLTEQPLNIEKDQTYSKKIDSIKNYTAFNGSYIEVSIKEGANYVSRKVDFGKLIKYLYDTLSVLANQASDDYLTKTDADTLYVPLTGTVQNKPITGTLNFADKVTTMINGTGKIHTTNTVEANMLSSTTASIKSTLTISNSDEHNGGLVVYGTAEISGDLTAHANIIGDDIASKISYQNAEFGFAEIDDLSAGNLTATTQLSAPGTVTLGTSGDNPSTVTVKKDFQVDGATSLSSGTINGNMTVKGNIYLDGSDSDKGRIVAGSSTDQDPPYLSKKKSGDVTKLYASSLQVGDYEQSNETSPTTVLEVKGDLKCNIGNTTTYIANADFSKQIYAPIVCGKEIKTAYKDDKTGDVYKQDTCGLKYDESTESSKIYQNSGIAELTAKAACWS